MTINIYAAPQTGNLSDLQDVSIVSPSTGQYLRYNSVMSKWQNVAIGVDIFGYMSGSLSGMNGINVIKTPGPDTFTIGIDYVNTVGQVTASQFNGSGAGLTNIPNSSLTNNSLTIGTTNIALGAITTSLAGLSSVTSTNFTGALTGAASLNILRSGDTMTGYLILNADPINALGAVTKQYVDNIASGVNVHAACETSTTAAGNLPAATYNNGTGGVGATLTANANGSINAINAGAGVGGYNTLAINARVLVKDQTTQIENGIYVVTALGTPDVPGPGAPWVLTRASDFDGSPTSEVQAGDLTYVQEGTLIGTQWIETTVGTGHNVSPAYDYVIVGTDNITFSQFSGPGTYMPGTGINIASNIISNTGVTSLSSSSSNLTVSSPTGSITLGFSSAPTLTGTNFTGIPNGALTNSSVTIGTTNIALGATITALSGLTSIAATTFTGNATTATTATNANNIAITEDTTTATSVYPTWVTSNTGDLPVSTTSTKLSFVPSTGVLTAVSFVGSLSGNATTATTATNATNTAIIEDTTTATSVYPTWVTANTGNLPQKTTSTRLSFVPSTGVLSATVFNGSLSGNATTATTSTNIAGGLAGNVPYQTGAGATSLLATGTSSQVLISGAIPSWTNTPTLTGTNFTGIPNGALTNSSVTIGTTNIALGATSTTLAGLTSVTSTTFVGSLSGNASTATTATTASTANALNTANNYSINKILYFAGAGINAYISTSPDANWGYLIRPQQDGAVGAYGFLNAAGSAIASITGIGDFTAQNSLNTGGSAYANGALLRVGSGQIGEKRVELWNANTDVYWSLTDTGQLNLYDTTHSIYRITTDINGNMVVAGKLTANNFTVGYLEVPQIATGSTTITSASSGKHIFNTSASQIYTIPANDGSIPIGTVITFVNQGAGTCTIQITTDTLYMAGSGATGTRTLGAYGMATILKTTATTWIISGSGLT